MTSIETGHSWSERWNPRNWTLTWKLVVVGLVPALLALVLGVLRVADQAGEAAEVGRSTRLLEVQDRGIGIPARDLPHLFERFYRGENVVGRIPGTGLGLFGARQLAEQHGGRIEVQSEESQGSTFSVWLPQQPPPSAG